MAEKSKPNAFLTVGKSLATGLGGGLAGGLFAGSGGLLGGADEVSEAMPSDMSSRATGQMTRGNVTFGGDDDILKIGLTVVIVVLGLALFKKG